MMRGGYHEDMASTTTTTTATDLSESRLDRLGAYITADGGHVVSRVFLYQGADEYVPSACLRVDADDDVDLLCDFVPVDDLAGGDYFHTWHQYVDPVYVVNAREDYAFECFYCDAEVVCR